jgi:hypothetical protein
MRAECRTRFRNVSCGKPQTLSNPSLGTIYAPAGASIAIGLFMASKKSGGNLIDLRIYPHRFAELFGTMER